MNVPYRKGDVYQGVKRKEMYGEKEVLLGRVDREGV